MDAEFPGPALTESLSKAKNWVAPWCRVLRVVSVVREDSAWCLIEDEDAIESKRVQSDGIKERAGSGRSGGR